MRMFSMVRRGKCPIDPRRGIVIPAFAVLCLHLTASPPFSGSPPDMHAFRPGLRGDDGDAYINIEIELVEVSRSEALRGERLDFEVTLRNRGEEVPRPVTMRVLSGKRVLASTVVSQYHWDVKDRMVVTIPWDTKGSEPGTYAVTVEAPLFGDAYEFDNVYRLPGEIILREFRPQKAGEPSPE